MKCDGFEPLAFITSLCNAPYNSSLATKASASSTSVWSDTSSQHSDDTTLSVPTSDSDSCDSCFSGPTSSSQSSVSSIGSGICGSSVKGSFEPAGRLPWQQKPVFQHSQGEPQTELPPNPRRTYNSATSRGRPPPLVRQADRKVDFVDNLVDSSTHIVEAIWPTSSVVSRNEDGNNAVLPLRTFIQETLRRSRTSYSTLQVALYYLILIKPHVPDHDFTMEQPSYCQTSQAVQCGRRMFLAALILASKYLQDRNFSARAWSKISGLETSEINRNEMAFLLAVNWKLHITEQVYNRWTECVMKFTPSQPPSPGSGSPGEYERQCEEFRNVILNLTPELDNVEELASWWPGQGLDNETPARSLYTPPNERVCAFGYEADVAPTRKCYGAPAVMEPTPATVYTPGRLAPALGLLPTPRLTPQSSGFSTPAVGAASYLLGKSSSMGFAMAQASCTMAIQSLDRWSPSSVLSPQSHFTRRSSLANSISTASSPESMVSDSSRISRSSSISSASSSVSAPSSKLDVQARCRYAKLCGERLSLRPTIASVPEVYEEECLTASPESYTGPVGKDLCDMSLGTPREIDDAARALQELQRNGAMQATAQTKRGSKRSRAVSIDNSLQDNVREMLVGGFLSNSGWPDAMVRARTDFVEQSQQIPVRAALGGSHKRVCCSTEAAASFLIPSIHPAVGGYGAPGMWKGILE
ncbi:hypothetical protein B0T26DRAFT_635837 [Lasiosphaeria miniovina]|uniref:G1/S-specific cyclin pas1 n=1 Tax=Lasiosphaeria miniovina TaxID=1954250 RepID=A0AA40EB89_9PEZI|nr:uncharacterized protein B0T26DRAFT_635837 [Lasiosphaeria miniovina]KAK0733610.1 hypothetical protein B0T26DRAFT_635837 [Lasiosphaeria miniovina]